MPELPGVRRASDLGTVPQEDGLPVREGLTSLLPWRVLRRGSVVGVAAGEVPGMTSLLLALLSGPSGAGAWCGVVGGTGDLPARAVAEAGVAGERLALVPEPGAKWAEVASALLDGFDVVAVHVPQGLGGVTGRRLAARARKRGAILVPYGAAPGRIEGADAVLSVVGGRWSGLGQGRGRLREREIVVSSRVRGRPVRTTLRLHGPEHAEPVADVVPLSSRRRP
ncbi:hypothetical protein Afil01_02430 [Actinorhabdospora filicis]|uniref:Uncharacterized protein n=1 Tax=Actinorhabdospora filicis TaxID=1785913 RepID=A0A9W6SHA4_9ACTN|nr:hypothetical protein Afil01_02430 [Actinorhabdospora filicis]